MRILSTLLILMFTAVPLAAAETAVGDRRATEPPAQYEIELLLFLRDATPGGEFWPEATELPEPARAIATVQGEVPPEFPPGLRMGSPSTALSGARTAGNSGGIVPLGEESYQLKAHAETLRRRGLIPLVHAAWRQVVGDRNNEDWLWLEGGPVYGLVRISLGRYLHIDTDLVQLVSEQPDTPQQAIRSQDHRRMRSGELHHLDQPGFGVLVQINRYDPPARARGPSGEPLMLESISPQPNGPAQPAAPASAPGR